MQVQIETEPVDWQPKTLSITFETKEEFELFNRMITWNIRVPKLVFEHNTLQQAALSDIMQAIYDGYKGQL